MIELLNCDCMEYMAGLEDISFDLAIVDPPYGIGESGGKTRTREKHINTVKHTKKGWDSSIPDAKYFRELARVSVNRIIWGANYMVEYLPPSMGWIYWDKKIGGDFSDGELAYSSFNKALKAISLWNIHGGNTGNPKIHPTQKPVKLYEWLLTNYSEPGQRILDTHLGSGSSAIAAHYFGVDFVGCELDEDYYNAACKRFDAETSQIDMFSV